MAKDPKVARETLQSILNQGQTKGQPELVESALALLKKLDKGAESAGGGGGGEGADKDGEEGEGEGPSDEESAEEAEGTEESEGDGGGPPKGERDKRSSGDAEREQREARARGQSPSAVRKSVEELWQSVLEHGRVEENSPEGGHVPAWFRAEIEGGFSEGKKSRGDLKELASVPAFVEKASERLGAAIAESRRLLAQIVLPVMEMRSYQKQGRFMSRRTAAFYTQSMTQPIERVYEINRSRLKQELPVVAFVVDTSGSFAAGDPLGHIVCIVEAFKRFQPPNQFGLWIFTDDWAKVKGFDEPWGAVDRLGTSGVIGRGSRRPECKNAFLQALEDISRVPGKHKLVVILSDFQMENISNAILAARWGGIHVLPIQAVSSRDEEMIRVLPRRQQFVRVKDYSEVVQAMLSYFDSFFKGIPMPGGWFTPDSGKTCYQTPP